MAKKFTVDGEYFVGSLGMGGVTALFLLGSVSVFKAIHAGIVIFGILMLIFGVKSYFDYRNDPFRNIPDMPPLDLNDEAYRHVKR
ncbi:hypothetical protein [Deinococcus xianganensis]|uniref:Uncharacterized protein n=1 Tax=Deinococcus xianganensis TaxID=1507289 RepID=A0A6I4YRD0_9DEIO|nr:hypothetical protein [Deinococcus xianganensis]MXV21547.1 hypothetical protein [Deinococcus xianganensis]